MRHGQSLANCKGLIVSTPENGLAGYGLSIFGKSQVTQSIAENDVLDHSSRIISSDFKRARESAEIVVHELKCTHKLILDPRLRERDFGDFELGSDENYHKTWAYDAVTATHTLNNEETADSVMERTTRLVLSLEAAFYDQRFLLVAHGDTLQILQAAFQRQAATQQRELPHLETAEIRELIFVP